MTKEQIAAEALLRFPVQMHGTPDFPGKMFDTHEYERQLWADGANYAAAKYASLLEEKDRELACLTSEAEQSLLLYNNMNKTLINQADKIQQQEGEIARLNKEVAEWKHMYYNRT